MIESSTAINSGNRPKLKRPEWDARKTWVQLRWLLILFGAALTGFLYLPRSSAETVLVTVVFALSNIVLGVTAPEKLLLRKVRWIVDGIDVLLVSATLFLLRAPGTYLYLGFIFVVVMAAIWRETKLLLFALATVGALYGVFSIFRIEQNGQ